MDKKKLLGRRLRELRKRKGINQEQLAEMNSVEPATISNIENGKNYPSMTNLENIVSILESSFQEVFDFEHKNSNESLIKQINFALKNNPDKVETFYKIIMALTK